MRFVGIDLAGKPENSTGFCTLILPGKDFPLGKTEVKRINTDEEILKEVELVRPDCIGIDAPLWKPVFGAWRPCETLLFRRGYKPLSVLIPSMGLLADRAIRLVRKLSGYKVIEIFAPATEHILGLAKEPRKNKDEYEALLAALTAKSYLEGRYEDLAGIIIPR